MQHDKITLSLVIPVYNEERNIKHCLDSIASQTDMPDEVIVVDNNCTDKTSEIASSYDFVSIIKESTQGRGYARNAGFDRATSEIIGRIDADSRLKPNWVETVKKSFLADPELAGVTGLGYTACLPGTSKFHTTLFSRTYYWFVHAGFGTITMWGSTMAIRRQSWLVVRDKLCLDDKKVHEDQDVSLWIAANGGKILQNNQLLITTDAQSFRYLPKLLSYHKLFFSTRKLHVRNGNLRSPQLRRLNPLKTLPGLVWAIILGIIFYAGSLLLFPIDLLITKIFRYRRWLA